MGHTVGDGEEVPVGKLRHIAVQIEDHGVIESPRRRFLHRAPGIRIEAGRLHIGHRLVGCGPAACRQESSESGRERQR